MVAGGELRDCDVDLIGGAGHASYGDSSGSCDLGRDVDKIVSSLIALLSSDCNQNCLGFACSDLQTIFVGTI